MTSSKSQKASLSSRRTSRHTITPADDDDEPGEAPIEVKKKIIIQTRTETELYTDTGIRSLQPILAITSKNNEYSLTPVSGCILLSLDFFEIVLIYATLSLLVTTSRPRVNAK